MMKIFFGRFCTVLLLLLGTVSPVFATNCHDYTSATGTVTQSGTPTPTNPIEPVFYEQGDMVLRAVGDVADSYDSTTGKITRRVGVKVLDGTEGWNNWSSNGYYSNFPRTGNYKYDVRTISTISSNANVDMSGSFTVSVSRSLYPTVADFKSYLATQHANGTPVVVYYPLAEETEEYIGTQWCNGIKIATTKYTEEAFAGLMTTLSEAITKVTNIVDDTVQQATEIGNLATTKQDRPDTDCPAGRKCLLIMGADNKPHWYLIQE